MATTHKLNRTVRQRRNDSADQKPRRELSLPTLEDLNEVSPSFFSYNVCIFGEKGVGKTSLASQFPQSLVFQFERGRRNLPIRQIPRRLSDGTLEPPLSWDEIDKPCTPFLPLLLMAIEEPTIQTIVVDTVDRMYEACFDYCCWEEGVKHPSAADEGHQVWNKIKQQFEGALGMVQDAGKQLVLISHAREKEIISRLGAEYTIVCATCTPTAWKTIQTICDFVFYYGFYGSRRALKVQGEDQIVCSNQVPGHFCSPEGEPLELLDMGHNPEEAFQSLLAGFNNHCYDLQGKQSSTTTPTPKRRKKSHG
jgi:GTPase SAR1 family protein